MINSDLSLFQNEIDKYTRFFGHEKKADQFLLNGKWTAWPEVKNILFGEQAVGPLPRSFVYNQNGIVARHQCQWTVLEADWQEKNPKVGKCFLEIVSQNKGYGGLARHCWIRLIDANSGVISVGLYAKMYKCFPFRSQVGKYISPDPAEFDPGDKTITRFSITQEQYNHLKGRVEAFQKNKHFFFNLKTRNCTVFVCELLSEIGISIKNIEYPPYGGLRRVLKCLKINPPQFVLKIFKLIGQFFRYLLVPFHLLILSFLGLYYSNDDVKLLPKGNLPKRNLCEILKSSYAFFPTVWKLCEWQEWIAEKRAAKIRELEKQGPITPEVLEIINYEILNWK